MTLNGPERHLNPLLIRRFRVQIPGGAPGHRVFLVFGTPEKPNNCLGTHLILFLDSGDQVMTHLDSSVEYGHNSSDTWEFNSVALEQLCSSAGIAYESQSFDTAQQFVPAKPESTPPLMEFQVDHVLEEDVREWGLALALGLPIAFGLLAVFGGALLWLGPVGWAVGSLEVVGTLVAMILTVWSHSRWRMKRSLSRQHLSHR